MLSAYNFITTTGYGFPQVPVTAIISGTSAVSDFAWVKCDYQFDCVSPGLVPPYSDGGSYVAPSGNGCYLPQNPWTGALGLITVNWINLTVPPLNDIEIDFTVTPGLSPTCW